MNEILLSNIKFLCVENNISVRELARDIGISAAGISKYKVSSPSLGTVEAIASFFGVTLDTLVRVSLAVTAQNAELSSRIVTLLSQDDIPDVHYREKSLTFSYSGMNCSYVTGDSEFSVTIGESCRTLPILPGDAETLDKLIDSKSDKPDEVLLRIKEVLTTIRRT